MSGFGQSRWRRTRPAAEQFRAPGALRKSSEVVTPLLVAAGCLGLPFVLAAQSCSTDDDQSEGMAPPAPTVDAGTNYPNNHYLPGVEYYHAPYRMWYPYPFNYYDAAHGWFRGGSWRKSVQEDADEQREEERLAGTAHFSGSTGYRPLTTSRPTPEAVQKANSGAAEHHANMIQRGGFGGSGRPAFS